MDNAELSEFLREFSEICKYPEYANIDRWLDSEDEKMVYEGQPTKFQGQPAILVGSKVIFGKYYNVIIQDDSLIKIPSL